MNLGFLHIEMKTMQSSAEFEGLSQRRLFGMFVWFLLFKMILEGSGVCTLLYSGQFSLWLLVIHVSCVGIPDHNFLGE